MNLKLPVFKSASCVPSEVQEVSLVDCDQDFKSWNKKIEKTASKLVVCILIGRYCCMTFCFYFKCIGTVGKYFLKLKGKIKG